jgi:hypothetical protein
VAKIEKVDEKVAEGQLGGKCKCHLKVVLSPHWDNGFAQKWIGEMSSGGRT